MKFTCFYLHRNQIYCILIQLTSLTQAYFCACPKPVPGFPMPCRGIFCVFKLLQLRVVSSVAISGIYYHHCLNFLFIIIILFFIHPCKKNIYQDMLKVLKQFKWTLVKTN